MREIKFRGISTRSKRFVYGCLETQDIHNGVSIREGGCIISKVDPETVGQFTGLHDRHGIDIYEGDIIQMGETDYMEQLTAIVAFRNGTFCLEYSDGERVRLWNDGSYEHYSMEFLNFEKIEVAGNIHENPELIEGVSKVKNIPGFEDSIDILNSL